MQTEKVQFDNGRGHTLTGRLMAPDGGAERGWALFAHCFTCTRNFSAVRRISEALAEAGFGVLSFDFTGLGESEGDFGAEGLASDVADLVAAADWLKQQGRPPGLLLGHSLGGAAAIAAGGRIDSVAAVASVAAPADAAHVTRLFQDKVETIEQKGEAWVSIGGQPFRLTRQFLEDLRESSLQQRAGTLGKPLMVFHSPVDHMVGIDNARRLYEAAEHPKSFVSLDEADHLLTAEADAKYVARVLAAWAGRYLPEGDSSAGDEGDMTRLPARDGHQLALSLDGPAYRVRLNASGHELLADEPTDAGGADTGPDPYALLLAALGSCTAITIRMYADRKGFPLESVSAQLSHERVTAEDQQQTRGGKAMVDRIQQMLRLEGALSDPQRRRLHEIADRCPVHRTLTGDVRIETELSK
jgi:putative redox protein